MTALPAPHWILKDIVAGMPDPIVRVRRAGDAPSVPAIGSSKVERAVGEARGIREVCDPAPGVCVRVGAELFSPRLPALYLLVDSIEPADAQRPVRSIHFVEEQPDRFHFVNLPPWSFDFAAGRQRRTLLLVQLPDETTSPVKVAYTDGAGGFQALGEMHRKESEWSFVSLPSEGIRTVAFASPTRPPRHFFVGGVPKSGTTWVEKILNAHPQILCLGQGDFFEPAALPGMLRGRLEREKRNYVQWTLPQNNPSLEIELHLAGRVWLAFHTHSRLWPGLAAVGDRSPRNSLAYQAIHAHFGDCRIIHCVRHPLDVVVSRLYHEWNLFRDGRGLLCKLDATKLTRLDETLRAGDGALRLAAEDADLLEPYLDEWIRLHELALAFRTAHPERIRMVHYEQLLVEPAPIIDGMFEFLLGHPLRNPVERAMVLGLSSFEALSGGRARGTADGRSFFRKGVAGDHRGRLSPALLDYARQKIDGLATELGYALED